MNVGANAFEDAYSLYISFLTSSIAINRPHESLINKLSSLMKYLVSAPTPDAKKSQAKASRK